MTRFRKSVGEAKKIHQSPDLRRIHIGLLFICLCASSVFALDRDRFIRQFHHTAWTAKDGAPSQISALAQTTDGYLWIGSAKGLFRFDGVRFEPFSSPTGINLPSHNIYALMATPDNGLWVSFRPSGLGFIKDNQITVFSRPEELPQSQVYCFARDSEGRIWAGTHTGLALLVGTRWIEIGADWNFTPRRIWTLFVDREGTLWVATDGGISFLTRGSERFQSMEGIVGDIPQIAQAKDGRLWITEYSKTTRPLPNASQDNPEIKVNADRLFFDSEGSLWISDMDNGIKRVRFPERLGNRTILPDDPEIESFKESDGLTQDPVHCLFEDREGNVWVGTNKGLDRFRYSSIVPVNLPSGHQGLTLLAGDKSDLWVASSSGKNLLHIDEHEQLSQSLPKEISSFYRGSDGIIWWGGKGGIWRGENNRFDFFPQPANTAVDWIWEVFRSDNDGGLWIGLGDVGIVHFKDGLWTNKSKPPGLIARVPSASYEHPDGRIWLGYTENRVFLLDGERVQAYSSEDGLSIGRIRVIRGRGPQVWFGGELGLAMFKNEHFQTIATNGEPFGTISGIIETSDGSLWLNELRGIVHISPDEVQKMIVDANYRVNYRLFDFLDGLPGGTQMNWTVSTAVSTTDGRLWFATDNGLARIDPASIKKNTVPPPVSIRSLSTETKIYETSDLQLSNNPGSLRIEFTALSLSIPERVQFRYRLENFDDNWHEAGNRREVYYTNLAPGTYRFQVIAANNDGLWNEEGAVLEFKIAPAFYQTKWFLLICIIGITLLVWLLYQWRLHHVKSRLNWQFEERLTERTRLARELHDTLLQEVFGASIQLDAVVENISEKSPIRGKLNRVLEIMRGTVETGRKTIKGLHANNPNESINLEKAFLRVKDELGVHDQVDFQVKVINDPRLLHSVIRDEIYRIGREALVNAFHHSESHTILVELEYNDKYFRLLISDDGCGIEPKILHQGRDSHWGLSGMRERAKKIGASLKISSTLETGTIVELQIPAHIAYESPAAEQRFKWLRKNFFRQANRQYSDKEQE